MIDASEQFLEAARKLRASEPYRQIIDRAGRGSATRLPLQAAAWVVGLAAEDLGRTALVLVPHESEVGRWVEAADLFVGAGRALGFPSPSLTPFQEVEAPRSVLALESATLDRLLHGGPSVVVTTPRALARRLPSARSFADAAIEVALGEEIDLASLPGRLTRAGYHREDLVTEVGAFAVRGGVLDLFPPGATRPLRLDFLGDTLESIRAFDPDNQRSLESIDRARILPLHWFAAGETEAGRLADALAPWQGNPPGVEARQRLARLRQGGAPFAGWESWLVLLHRDTTSLPDLMARPWVVVVDPTGCDAAAAAHAERLRAESEHRHEEGRLWVEPAALEWSLDEVRHTLGRAELAIGELVVPAVRDGEGKRVEVDFAGSSTDVFHGQLPRFPREVETARARGERLILVAPGENLPRVREFLDDREVPLGRHGVEIEQGDLERGFRLPPAGIVVFGEAQLFAPIAALGRRPGVRSRLAAFTGGLRDLKPGDFVVHADHGIGQFLGLRSVGGSPFGAASPTAPLGGAAASPMADGEVMELAYSAGQRLLVPLHRLDLVSRYSGLEGVAPRLDQLGGTSWNKAKSRVKKGLRDMAQELLKLYAERQLARAPALPPDTDWMRQFEAAFAYEETADQLEAISTIKEDLGRERPMDRLLCGDVGYGKTEVAMRAAFKVVDAGYQVAVLCPTTILADQHWETFRRRFSGFPVEIEMVSRFRSPADLRAVRDKLRAGRVDILVGTHRLLSRDMDLPRLALLVVDEEQRFGVAQKERLKQLKTQVHVLAMSATPVPRTLQFSLAGVRDLSVIETPPKDRMAVETAVLPYTEEVVREAIEFERDRGGQIYYVYNRVETIDRLAASLRELFPGLRVTVGHGQLDERELSRRMHAFTAGEFDLLLATTIIENGIDIPNVNTMIVHRADRFGLAQLYQLRGRVGRSNQLAYCYLLVPQDRVLSEAARKRLEALREFSDLGAGFRIAARDLEIRGAGNLLGGEQSGHIATVGIEAYLKLLEESLRELRGEATEEAPSAAIDLGVSMSIPLSYVADASLRMDLYRRIAAGEQTSSDLLAELEDRFGAAPPAVRTLLDAAELKRLAEVLRVQSIGRAGGRLTVRLRQDSRVKVERLIEVVSRTPGAAFSPSGVLSFAAAADPRADLERARALLDDLAAAPAAGG